MRHSRSSGALRLLAVVGAVAAVALAGCGETKKDKAATQTAAKVNKEEITVHQINFLLSQQRALPPEAAASASRQVLERLIDQELTLQKAAELKVDRDPRVSQQIEAARRDIISRAYLEKIAEGAPKPTPQEVNGYYESHPALFKERRVYSLQELLIEATPDQVAAAKTALSAAKSFGDFVGWLKSNNIKFTGGEAVRAAEQLPLSSLDQFAKMKDGQAVFSVRPNGAQVVHVVNVRNQPVVEQQAIPAIEQFLRNDRKRKLVADDLQALRTAAKIVYVGDFAADAARAPYQPPSAPDLAPLTTMPATLPAPTAVAAPQMDVAPIDSAPASMPSGSTLDKGLKGLK